jgi:Flp pilus assembly pilin Flp
VTFIAIVIVGGFMAIGPKITTKMQTAATGFN